MKYFSISSWVVPQASYVKLFFVLACKLGLVVYFYVYFNLGSVLIGIVYKDLHELLLSSLSNSDNSRNSR